MNRVTFGTHDNDNDNDNGDVSGRDGDDRTTSNAYTSSHESSHQNVPIIDQLVFPRRSSRLHALLDRILHKLVSTPGQGLQSLHSKVACACVDLLSDPHVLQTLILYQSNVQSMKPQNSQSNFLNTTVDNNSHCSSNSHEHPPLAQAASATMRWHHRWSDEWRQRLLQGRSSLALLP